SQSIAIPRPAGRVVRRSVAFDRQQIATRSLGINDGKVDEEPSGTDLVVNRMPVLLESLRHLKLKFRIEPSPSDGRSVHLAGGGEAEECFQCPWADRLGPGQVDVVVSDGTEDGAGLLSAGDQNVE